MTSNRPPVTASAVIVMAAGAIIIASLYLARDVLIPLALAVLFCFMLAPLVRRLQHHRLGRVPAVVLVVLLSSSLVVGVGYLVTTQLVSLTYKLPEYRDNIRHKIQALRGHTDVRFNRVAETWKEIRQELTTQPSTSTAPAVEVASSNQKETLTRASSRPDATSTLIDSVPTTQPAAFPPISVQVVEATSLWETAGQMMGYLAEPIGKTAIVFVLVLFMLIQLEDLRDRFISLMGRGRINITTIALDDAAERISRYLLMQLAINALYGVPVGIGLYLIGVPNALTWGLLGALLRYLPYIGPWICAGLPTLLALAVFDDWYHVALVLGLFIVLEVIINNAVEPLLYGNSTGLSQVAILVSAVFWTWLWGPVGLFLATPLTACLAVLGKHIPQLEFLSVLLGDQPVFDPATRFYQRLVAMDQEEAEDLMEEYLEKCSLLDAYDQFLIPAIHLAEQNRHRGRLDAERYGFLVSTLRSMIADLGETKIQNERKREIDEMRASAESGPVHVEESSSPHGEPRAPRLLPEGFSVLCVPARDEADEIVARMFAQVLEAMGFHAEVSTTSHLKSEVLQDIRESSHQVVCVSAMPPGALTHARYLCKRMRRAGDVQILVGLWDSRANMELVQRRLISTGATHVIRTFHEAIELVRHMAQRQLICAPQPPISENLAPASAKGPSVRDELPE